MEVYHYRTGWYAAPLLRLPICRARKRTKAWGEVYIQVTYMTGSDT